MLCVVCVCVCCSQAMEGSMLTLSLANWMELPGLKLKDWMREKRRYGVSTGSNKHSVFVLNTQQGS